MLFSYNVVVYIVLTFIARIILQVGGSCLSTITHRKRKFNWVSHVPRWVADAMPAAVPMLPTFSHHSPEWLSSLHIWVTLGGVSGMNPNSSHDDTHGCRENRDSESLGPGAVRDQWRVSTLLPSLRTLTSPQTQLSSAQLSSVRQPTLQLICIFKI